MTPNNITNARNDRRDKQRRRQVDRWERRMRPIVIAVVIDVALLAAFLVAQRRTQASLRVLSKRLRGEPVGRFPRPRFIGNGSLEDFEQFAGELEQIRRMATTDPITGLVSPAMTQNNLLLYTEVAAREDSWLSACVADLDHFKDINDTFGHLACNEILKQLGDRLRISVGAGQPVGRWGGDEFLLLLPRMDVVAAREVADAVRRSVDESPFALEDGTRLHLTVTLGVAAGRGEAIKAADRLFHAADADLRDAKAGGRNRVGAGRTL